MKQYIATVTVKGGIWRGQRQKLAVGPLQAETKLDAANKALDIVAKDKTVGRWEEIVCTPANVRTTSIKPA